MTKFQFLNQLNSSLKGLSSEEREDILQDFEEHFANGSVEGKSEEQIADSLGSPNQIAKELLATYHLEKVETTATTGNIIRAVWAVIGLGFFNLIIVLGPFIGLAAVVFAGWASGIAFIVSPLLLLIDIVIYPGGFEWFELFFSMALCGAGIFITVGMYYGTKVLMAQFLRYLKYNVSLVKGGLKNDE
ncbi:HAAS signaling domain-containing protein [Virgibacillus oceani]|uniref:DUF1700 domain-containing protein n=1 Tax=Virgibacillus oceani TaxID=1479511 RepID=A0A917M366_9BACI|nr:DUF1700 domain-containing protein [Virgibacillus oceani]GGG74412.1 hypothetical protein GCM10011398_18840 [Virgibacillus oceani]